MKNLYSVSLHKIVFFMLSVVLIACGDKNEEEPVVIVPVPVTGISLNTDKLELLERETATLVATVQPDDAANDSISWASSDDAIATVDQNGEVVAITAGEAVITVTTTDGNKTANCAVLVAEACPCAEGNPVSPADVTQWLEINTDKSLYSPGEQVKFSLVGAVSGNVVIRYMHLSEKLSEQPLTATTWTWTPPATDFKGYLVELIEKTGNEEKVLGSVGIDVSSDWKKFPRYGFLSKYGELSDAEVEGVISNLNRYHINGLQYYDWLYKHHKPLAGTPDAPMEEWRDIFNRRTLRSTTNKYLAAAKKYGMKSMMYNLCFGAWKNADQDGVDETWYIFRDKNHTDKDRHELTYGLSDIFLVDPSIPAWQTYMAQQNEDVYKVYGFDGYHIDQLGDRGARFNYNGQAVNLTTGYLSFINAMKLAHPNKRLVMNAVSEFGQSQIAQGDVDFFYTELWGGDYDTYVRILNSNRALKASSPSTVFASYINYNYAQKSTVFNTPGVLFADAFIFANGGAHLELGEHMLYSEYFPNSGMKMSAELEKYLLSYYNFMVAYENLLRDEQKTISIQLSNPDNEITFGIGYPRVRRVVAYGKQSGKDQIIHLINFTKTTSTPQLDARDVDGKQVEPDLISNLCLRFIASGPVKKVWIASPDNKAGASEQIPFCQSGDNLTFTLPYLKYWSMIVVEYE
jgi:dextranase